MKKNILKIFLILLLVVVVAFPMITYAQPCDPDIDPFGCVPPTNSVCSSTGLGGIICKLSQATNGLIPLLLALGVVYFVWGVVTYVIGGDDEAKKKGRDKIIYGLIGLAIIVSLWGLVNIITGTFGLGSSNNAPTKTQIQNLLPK